MICKQIIKHSVFQSNYCEETKTLNPIKRMMSLSNLSNYIFQRGEYRSKTEKDYYGIITVSKPKRKYTFESNEKLSEKEIKYEIIQKILETRNRAATIIQKAYINHKIQKRKKMELLIEKIINSRASGVLSIQKNFRMYLVKKNIRELTSSEDYVFIYNYLNLEDVNPVSLKTQITQKPVRFQL